MTVDLASVPPGVSLVEPDDCTCFDVIVRGIGDADDFGRVLAGAAVGLIEGSEALVDVAAVRRLAGGSVAPSWEADFLAMLDFARDRGWLTEDGEGIRAHVEWQ